MRDMSIEFDEEKIDKKIEELAENWKKDVSIPGFRKGKAPVALIKSHLGERLRAESLQNMIQDEMIELIEKYEPFVYGQPRINNIEEEDDSMKLDFSLDVPPSLEELGIDIDGLEIEESGEEKIDIDGEIERLREINSELVSVDSKIKKGDNVFLDVKTDENSISNFSITIGNDEFSKVLTGLTSGEEEEISTKLPEDFPVEELAGREGKVKIKINEVKEKVKPEVDDEFARDLGFSDLDELKGNLSETLKKESEEEREEEIRDVVVEKLLENVEDFELSPGLLEIQKNTGIDEDRLEERVRSVEILDAIALEKNFEIEESELDEWMEKIAESEMSDFDEMGEESIRFIKQSILREKSIDYILNKEKEEEEENG